MIGKTLTFALSLAACTVVADTVEFKSGSRLTGKVAHIEGGVITFAADDVGTVKIDQAKVAKLVTDAANTILYVDKTRQEGVISMTNGVYALDGTKPLDMAQVKAVNPEEEKWHGSVNLSASAARGNTRSETVTVIGNVNRRWEKDRFVADGAYNFGQSGTDRDNKRKTDDRIMLAAQEDHFWSAMFYSYVNGKFERDNIMDLDHRYRLGTGLGLQWLDGRMFESTGKWSFNQEAGIEYVNEKWENQSSDVDDNYASFRYAHHLKYVPRWVDTVEWFHNFEYHPDVSEWQDVYIINADLGFITAIWGGWDLLGKIEWDYNSAPAASAKNSDLRYILGLGYKW